jgi:GNAT superfamily N-acetyltransferase
MSASTGTALPPRLHRGEAWPASSWAWTRPQEPLPHYEVWSLYVLPQYRGAGVATALIERMAEWTTKDIPVLITTTGPARPFYKSLGFEEECRINTSSVSKIKEALGRI